MIIMMIIIVALLLYETENSKIQPHICRDSLLCDVHSR